jgi:prepilin signal peptidase PulO-like enzyme (type II secretory pathway)
MGVLRVLLELFLIFLIISIFGGFILSLLIDITLALPSAIMLAIIFVVIYHLFRFGGAGSKRRR